MVSGRLLIFDDDAAVAQTIAFVAEGIGLEARHVSRHSEFVEEVDAWNPTHLAIDLVMPDVDGVEALRMLAQRGSQASIIITSGVGSRVLDAARRSAAERGLNIIGVLSKPFMPATLRQLLAAPRARPSALPAAGRVMGASLEVTEAELRRGLERQEFLLSYQPKIECSTEGLAGFEALVRWNHPTAGIIMPDQFIGQTERFGLIDALTDQVFAQGLEWFIHAFPRPGISLSVNISALSLADFDLGDRIADMCERFAIEPSRLILELTETSTMADPITSLDLLTRLRMQGFQLSIDDFGTGYSSMLQLVRLPFSEMKVDKSFVMTSSQSKESRMVVKSIVDLGHSLGLSVAAEGVEDARTLQYLDDIGCDFAQGYFVARAMSGTAVAEWTSRWESALALRQPAAHPRLAPFRPTSEDVG